MTFHMFFFQLSRLINCTIFSKTQHIVSVTSPLFYSPSRADKNKIILIRSEKDYHEICSLSSKYPESNIYVACMSVPLSKTSKSALNIISICEDISIERLFNLILDICEHFSNWDREMNHICTSGKCLHELLDKSAEYSNISLSLFDKDIHPVYNTEKNSNSAYDPALLVKFSEYAMLSSNSLSLKTFSFTHHSDLYLCQNIYLENAERIGTLIGIVCLPELQSYMKDILFVISRYLAKFYQNNGSFMSEASDSIFLLLKSILLRGLQNEVIYREEQDKIIEEFYSGETQYFTLIQLRPSTSIHSSLSLEILSRELEKQYKDTCCVIYNQKLFLLYPIIKHNENLHLLLNEISAAYHCLTGCSRIFNDLYSIYDAYIQTEKIFQLGLRRNPQDNSFLFEDYAVDYILYNGIIPFSPENMTAESLIFLQKYDLEKNTDYYNTLHVYFDCWFNASLASRKLFIHRSTFLERLKKIEEMIQVDLSSSDIRLYYILSFQLLDNQKLYFPQAGDLVYHYIARDDQHA
ncbi:MAG: helix-turn-helix domain-containing protein [Lachnospiraceae bacterium]|nr:helix-turn-helix domain-containing protein [Lachnospiraceae bacterium]